MNNKHICPRCNGGIPNNERIGEYCGALSRLDNATEICSECGEDEAMQEYLFGRVYNWKKNRLDSDKVVN